MPWWPAAALFVVFGTASALLSFGVIGLVGIKVTFFYLLLVAILWLAPFDARDRDHLVSILMGMGAFTSLVGIAQLLAGPAALVALGIVFLSAIGARGRRLTVDRRTLVAGAASAAVLLLAYELPRIAGLSSGAISVARAADTVFPSSSRFGFSPASDMALSKRFSGFERLEGGATLSIVELPSTAFVDLEKSFTDENLRTQGFVVATREAIKVAGDVDAVLFTGEQPAPEGAATPAIKKWLLLVGDTTVTGIIIAQTVPDAETPETMRNMLTSVKIRPELTLDEQVERIRAGELGEGSWDD
jgi:hypothetical protein